MSLYMTQLTATSLCLVQDIQDYVSLTLGHRVDIVLHTRSTVSMDLNHTQSETQS